MYVGFGSTRRSTVQRNSVHYDCGYIITENGELIQFTTEECFRTLNVPTIYAVYFSTFGAMVSSMCNYIFLMIMQIFSRFGICYYSINLLKNLHGPILSPSAIADNSPIACMAGNSLRTKVCHFVRARLFSTFNFLAIRFNQDDACILLNCCFERMAYLANQPENTWIKSIYQSIDDKLNAERMYQNEVFYSVYEQLTQSKTYVNRLQLQSQIQFDLQNYISHMPITVRAEHFRTEMYNPKNAQLSMHTLQQFFDSTEFLQMTKYIYDLSQFYLLLHQTYAQLIEREKFFEITLKELYDRAEEHLTSHTFSHRRHQAKDHMDIILKGIKAVNAYHTFTGGLIRPGPCDETQRFTLISLDTPVHCLLTNENPDEGDIVMRILR